MATRKTRGIDTSSLPSTQDLISLSARPSGAEGIDAVTSGLKSGFDLSQTLADKQMLRQQQLATLTATIQKAKEDALQKKRESDLAATVAQTTPAATRPISNLTFGGGQIPLAKNTQSFQQEQPARVDQAMLAAYPKETTQTNYANEKEKLKSERDAQEAINMQNLKFSQAKDLLKLKNDQSKTKGGKIPTSLINDMNLIESQKNQLDSIEKLVNTSGSSGAKGFGRDLLSKVTLGNIAPELRLYDQNRPATAVSIYRALTGDTRLSDSDAKARALPLLPVPGEPKEVQQNKINYLRAGIERRKKTIQQVSEMAKNNDLTPEQLTSLSVMPLPESGASSFGEVDPSKFIEE